MNGNKVPLLGDGGGMKIAFHGAARTVTGSKHLLTLKMGKKFYWIVVCSREWEKKPMPEQGLWF